MSNADLLDEIELSIENRTFLFRLKDMPKVDENFQDRKSGPEWFFPPPITFTWGSVAQQYPPTPKPPTPPWTPAPVGPNEMKWHFMWIPAGIVIFVFFLCVIAIFCVQTNKLKNKKFTNM